MNLIKKNELTQKQKDLVNRLEKIRQENTKNDHKETNSSEQIKKKTPRRNEKHKQYRNKKRKKKKDPTPLGKKRKNYNTPVKRKKEKKLETNKKKEKEQIRKQLTNGQSLSRAIVLSEIIDKPLALRKK